MEQKSFLYYASEVSHQIFDTFEIDKNISRFYREVKYLNFRAKMGKIARFVRKSFLILK